MSGPKPGGPRLVGSGAPSNSEAIRVLRRDIAAALRGFVQEIKAALGESCGRCTLDADALHAAIADIAARQETLAQQIAVFEVFQARFDATLTAAESMPQKAGPARAGDRGLRIAIAGLALLSAASLVIGIVSVWR